MSEGFTCSCCGEWHTELPMSYGFDAPLYWHQIPEEERESRVQLSSDQCVLDDRHFFVRGRIVIPVLEEPEDFEWGVWVSLSADSFRRISNSWHRPGRENDASFFGWLSNDLPVYPSTLNLKTMVHNRPVGERPIIEIEPSDHPLSIEQQCGITRDRVREIAAQLLHPQNEE